MAVGAPFPVANGATLFQRIARLTFFVPQVGPIQGGGSAASILQITGAGDGSTPGIRFRFEIMKTSEKEPNTCKITITNLAPSTRQLLQQTGVKVLLEAGYQNTGMTGFFQGDVSYADHLHPAEDWETVIKCRDGDLWYRWQRMNGQSFGSGVTVQQLVQAICSQTGMPFPTVVPTPTRALGWDTPFQFGYTLKGTAQAQLDKLIKGIGLVWSIQSGQLQILGPGQSLNTSIPLISPETGLWGSAEMGTSETKGKPALLKMVCALLPVKPRGVVHLTDARYNTDLTVVKAEFVGDTEGGPWDTTIYGTPNV